LGVVEVEDSVEAVEEDSAVVGGADERARANGSRWSLNMKTLSANRVLSSVLCIAAALAVLWVLVPLGARQTTNTSSKAARVSDGVSPRRFDTPQQAADALADAAEKFDVRALEEIFGSEGDDVVLFGEYGQDRERASRFAVEAREKMAISIDPARGTRAFVLVGNEDWPFPVPLVKAGTKWVFDANAGRQEMLYRQIGGNELDAIAICRGYVQAQQEYALRKREGYDVHQYAQRIVSTPGKQDGLAWQNQDGSWGGPVGESIARAIEQGYTSGAEPYHGYFFKILKGQGPAAPLGEMDYMVKGLMIGGFALAAVPAEYGVSGVKSFIVSQDGVVYQKDFGPATLDQFKKMDRYNPDTTWQPVEVE